MKKIRANAKVCAGCTLCTLACSVNNIGVANPHKSAIVVTRDPWKRQEKINVCQQCKNAKCIAACPTGALYYDQDEVVRIDQEKCNACEACVAACPFDSIYLAGERLIKCDLCNNTEPQCIRVCSVGAIQLFEDAVGATA